MRFEKRGKGVDKETQKMLQVQEEKEKMKQITDVEKFEQSMDSMILRELI